MSEKTIRDFLSDQIKVVSQDMTVHQVISVVGRVNGGLPPQCASHAASSAPAML